jgi:hypothetical protein
MRGIAQYPLISGATKLSKPHYHVYREVYATSEVDKRIEDHINQEMANGGFNTPHPLAIIPRGLHSYEVFFGKVEQVPLTDEEIAELEARQAEQQKQFIEEGAKRGPERFEIDTAKLVLRIFLDMLPGGECEKEQRLERISKAMEVDAGGIMAAYQIALKELKEGKAEDFSDFEIREE